MSPDVLADFELANRAFEQFTVPERLRALEVFAALRYASIADRFYEAVYVVIRENRRTA